MSKITFLTTQINLNLLDYGIDLIKPNKEFFKLFPCLVNKKYIYDFDSFNEKISYKNFINHLQNICYNNNTQIEITTLWQTTNEKEIFELNTFLEIVKITKETESLKYKL